MLPNYRKCVTEHVHNIVIPQSNPLKRERSKLSRHTNSPNPLSPAFPVSLFVIIYMHMEWWERKQWTFVVGAGFDALMNGSLIPEMQFVNVTCSLWLTHWGDTMRRGLWKDGRAKNPDKAAPLSCQQGVFELSPGKERREEFWEAELRVNSIRRKTTTATRILPNQVALLKCKASLLQFLTKNSQWLKVRNIICTITLPKLHV